MKNLSNEDLLDQLITRANQVSIISESNDVHELREMVLERMQRNAVDLTHPEVM